MKRAWNGATETTAALLAFLFPNYPSTARRTDAFVMVDLLTFALPFGSGGSTVLRYSSAEVDLTFEGHLYGALGTRFVRTGSRCAIGLEVDTLELTLYPQTGTNAPDVVPGTTLPISQAIQSGLFDDAIVSLRRLYLATPPVWGTPIDPSLGAITIWGNGVIGDIQASRSQTKISVRSGLDRLRAPVPKNTFQPGCLNNLYDAPPDGTCNLSRTGSASGQNFQASAVVVGASSTTLRIVTTAAPSQPDHFFEIGTLAIASGAFEGLARSVKTHVGATFDLVKPFPFVLPDGQAITLQAGCDKLLATCVDKFNNRANFRGTPYIPVPESAV